MENEFSNKELLEMMIDFKSDVKGLQTEMLETRSMLKSYNGLRQKIMEIEVKLAELLTKEACKKDNKNDWKWVLGWVIAVGSLIISIFTK